MRNTIKSKLFGDIEITEEDGFYGDIQDLDNGLTLNLFLIQAQDS